jgi:phosphoserine phosphatase
MIDVTASTNGFQLVIASKTEDLPSDFRLKLQRTLASNLPADQALTEVSQIDATTQTARRTNGITSRVRMVLPSRAVTPDVRAGVAALCESHRVDHAFMPVISRGLRDYAVLAMDMDSTLITIECIDELGDWCGRKAEIAAITEAAMRGPGCAGER